MVQNATKHSPWGKTPPITLFLLAITHKNGTQGKLLSPKISPRTIRKSVPELSENQSPDCLKTVSEFPAHCPKALGRFKQPLTTSHNPSYLNDPQTRINPSRRQTPTSWSFYQNSPTPVPMRSPCCEDELFFLLRFKPSVRSS